MNVSIRGTLDEGPRRMIEHLSEIVSTIKSNAGIPDIELTVVVAEDFAASVRAVLEECGSPTAATFTAERIGGIAVAKVIPMVGDYSETTMVISGELLVAPGASISPLAVFLLAHEFAHLPISRARHASGAMENVPEFATTGTEVAQWIARHAAEEYRADLTGSIIFERLCSTGDRGATAYDVFGDSHADSLDAALVEVFPGWPDVVHDYRLGGRGLDDLAKTIFEQSDQVFTLVAHAEATATTGGQPSPLAVRQSDEGVDRYLAETWSSLHAATGGPLIGDLSETIGFETRIAVEGGNAVLRMWERLGLYVEEVDAQEWALWVDSP